MIVCDICKNPKSNPFKVEIQTLKVSGYSSGKKANGTVADYEKMDVCDNCLTTLTNKITVLVNMLTEHGQDVHIGYQAEDEYTPEDLNSNPVGETQEY